MGEHREPAHEQPGRPDDDEITNTGTNPDDAPKEDVDGRLEASTGGGASNTPASAADDDAWHDMANRGGDRGEGAVPMRGGNTAE